MVIEPGDYTTIGQSRLTWLVERTDGTLAWLVSGQTGMHRIEFLDNMTIHTKGSITMTAEQKAWDELARLTEGSPGRNWRWSIPANPERDSDLILAAGLTEVAAERDRLLETIAATCVDVVDPEDGRHYYGMKLVPSEGQIAKEVE